MTFNQAPGGPPHWMAYSASATSERTRKRRSGRQDHRGRVKWVTTAGMSVITARRAPRWRVAAEEQ